MQENTARRADLADLTAFVAVADNLSFREAASRIGVTPNRPPRKAILFLPELEVRIQFPRVVRTFGS